MTDHNTAYRGDYDTQPEEDDPLAELARIVSGDAPANSSGSAAGQAASKPQAVPAQNTLAQDDISNLDFAAALAEELDPAPVAEATPPPPASPAAAQDTANAGLTLEDQLLAEMGQGVEPQPSAAPVRAAPVQSTSSQVTPDQTTPAQITRGQAEPAPSDADAALARLEAVAQSLTSEQAGVPAEHEPAANAAEVQSQQDQPPQSMAVGNTLIDQDSDPLDGPQNGMADAEADLEAGFAEVFAEELGLEEADIAGDIDLQGYETAPQADNSGDVVENHFADAFAKELAIDSGNEQEMPASHVADDGTIDPGVFPGGYQDDDFGMEAGQQPAAQVAKQAAGSNRGFRLAVGALIVALLVGTGVVAWGTFGSGQPGEGGETPVIRADNEPAKVKPEDPGGKVIANQENQVYDRVAGGQGEENNTQEELITSREQPVDVAEKSATRLSPDAEGGASDAPLGLPPKKVRTLVVKPDGTIVSSAASAPQDGQAAGEPLPLTPQPQTLAMAQTGEESNSAAEAVQPQETEDPAVISLDGAKSTGEIALPTPSPLPAPQPPVAVAPAPKPVVSKPAAESDPGAPTQIAAVSESSQQPAVADRPAVTSSEWKIQVSSQRSRDAAESSFSNIKQRFSSILGDRSAAIERADIEGKGTFYRVKVLAESKSDATNTCNRLKGAGGSCFVTQ